MLGELSNARASQQSIWTLQLSHFWLALLRASCVRLPRVSLDHRVHGFAADAITHPLSTAKARLQVQQPGSAGAYRSTAHALSEIVRHEGFRCGLAFVPSLLACACRSKVYAGFGVVVAAAPARAVYFGACVCDLRAHPSVCEPAGAYEATKRTLGPDSSIVHSLAGSLAQLSGSLIWVPMDVVKV